MCEQCLTEMLTLQFSGKYNEDRPAHNFYIGIARTDSGVYQAGDIMVGRWNDPDIRYRYDLFTTEQCLVYLSDDQELPASPVGQFFSAPKNFSIFGTPHHLVIPGVVMDFCRRFGYPHPDINKFPLHVLATVGDLFVAAGVPTSAAERRSWAVQIPNKIASARCIDAQTSRYALSYYHYPSDGDWQNAKWKELLWQTGDPIKIPD